MKYITMDENRPIDVVLLGRIAVDLNPIDYFQPLEKCTTFKKYLGGSPANVAVGLARHGMNVGFYSRISDDSLGDFVFNYFRKEGIDTSRIKRCEHGEKIGLTFTEIRSPEDSRILMYRDSIADLKLEPSDIDEAYIRKAKAILISGTALAASPSREAAYKAMLLARKNGTAVFLDIDYRPYNWSSEDEISVYYSMAADQADIIMGSREEFDLMHRLMGISGDDKKSAELLHRKHAKIVIIKHGKQGSSAYINDHTSYSIKPFPINALKSFGGGDGYAAGFLYGLFQGWEIMDCLEFGSAEASMMVASHSCSEDLPNKDQVKAFIKMNKEKYGDIVVRR